MNIFISFSICHILVLKVMMIYPYEVYQVTGFLKSINKIFLQIWGLQHQWGLVDF